MPEGWMVSRDDGGPLTDPKKSAAGLLLPIGGYKGSGLALVLGLLAGTLNGAAFGRDVIDFNYDDERVLATTATSSSRSTWRALCRSRHSPPRSTGTCAICANSQRLPGVDAIRLPGEQRWARREDRARNGVPMPPELLAQLDKLAGELRVKR